MKGWVKIHRSMLKWEWWDDHNTARLLLYLLLTAAHEDVRFRGKVIKRGQLVTTLVKISEDTGISVQSVRTSLTRLISTNEITSISTNKYRLITICKYENYQIIEEKTNKQINNPTNNQLTNNQQTTNKHKEQELKNEKNINNIYSSTSGNAHAREAEDQEQNFYFDAYNSSQWREWVQMQVKIEQEQISAYIDEFHAFCQMAEKRHHSRADYQIHFVSWLKKQLAKETTQQQTNKTFTHGNNRSKKCFSADEINIIVNAGLQGHNSQ